MHPPTACCSDTTPRVYVSREPRRRHGHGYTRLVQRPVHRPACTRLRDTGACFNGHRASTFFLDTAFGFDTCCTALLLSHSAGVYSQFSPSVTWSGPNCDTTRGKEAGKGERGPLASSEAHTHRYISTDSSILKYWVVWKIVSFL